MPVWKKISPRLEILTGQPAWNEAWVVFGGSSAKSQGFDWQREHLKGPNGPKSTINHKKEDALDALVSDNQKWTTPQMGQSDGLGQRFDGLGRCRCFWRYLPGATAAIHFLGPTRMFSSVAQIWLRWSEKNRRSYLGTCLTDEKWWLKGFDAG